MKFKHVFISFAFIAGIILTASQVAFVNAVSTASPITGPITSPITPTPTFQPTPTPTTRPTPTPKPVVKYTVTGTVTRKIYYIYRIKNKTYTYFFDVPVKSAIIKAIDQKTGKITSATTNSYGIYNLQLEKGLYSISASDAKKTAFSPSKITINLKNSMSSINFRETQIIPLVNFSI
jgi:hypothetical protein